MPSTAESIKGSRIKDNNIFLTFTLPFSLSYNLKIKTDQKGKDLIKKFETDIKKTTLLRNIISEEIENGTVIKIDDLVFELRIVK